MDLAQSFESFVSAKFFGPVYVDRKNSIYQLIKQSKYFVHSNVQGTLQDCKKKKEVDLIEELRHIHIKDQPIQEIFKCHLVIETVN